LEISHFRGNDSIPTSDRHLDAIFLLCTGCAPSVHQPFSTRLRVSCMGENRLPSWSMAHPDPIESLIDLTPRLYAGGLLFSKTSIPFARERSPNPKLSPEHELAGPPRQGTAESNRSRASSPRPDRARRSH